MLSQIASVTSFADGTFAICRFNVFHGRRQIVRCCLDVISDFTHGLLSMFNVFADAEREQSNFMSFTEVEFVNCLVQGLSRTSPKRTFSFTSLADVQRG